MTDWQLVCLAVMAASLFVMAAIQIGLIVVAIRVAKQLSATAEEFRREIRPLVAKVHRIADDAQRATSLAALQVERVDQMLSTTAARVDEAVTILRNAMGGPIRQGAAIVMVIRALIAAFQRRSKSDGPGRDEDDALFVG